LSRNEVEHLNDEHVSAILGMAKNYANPIIREELWLKRVAFTINLAHRPAEKVPTDIAL
jgi:hypothetical protein